MQNNNLYVAIMAGGVGSRFWPGSREARPKQFLDIMGTGKTLLQMTFERHLELCPPENIYILTNQMYKALVLEQLPQITEAQILCEPSRNNTAPCLAYVAFKLYGLNENATFIVASSDHIILNTPEYINKMRLTANFAARYDALMTLAIEPSRPDTGYGYIRYDKNAIQAGVYTVKEFCEKPDLATAESFLKSGDYAWNSGMFVWQANTLINAFEALAPDIHAIFEHIKHDLNTPNEQAAIDEWYPRTRSISIDFAIMEGAQNVYTVPSDFGWSDLGTWNSLHAESEKDAHNNVLHGTDIHIYESQNSMIRVPNDKLVVIKGLDDFIVIDEGDVLLICPKNREQEIKAITQDLKRDGKQAFL
jgi:mannose-1-phosphate guanylyltransferase